MQNAVTSAMDISDYRLELQRQLAELGRALKQHERAAVTIRQQVEALEIDLNDATNRERGGAMQGTPWPS